MANVIQVTPQQLRTKADELKRMNEQFKQECDKLRTQEGQINNMWEGEAKEKFDSEFKNRSKVQLDNFYNAIAQYEQKLRNAAKEYENAEKRNIDVVSAKGY